jgi:hypothetical protein
MNNNFENLIHIENGLYCLNDIAEKLILSKNVKEYIKKIKNKEWIKGNYYISKDDMKIMLSKCKTVIGQQYLNFIGDNIVNKRYIDYEKNELIFKNNIISFIEYDQDIYFKANDVCDLLGHSNYSDTINKYVEKHNIY